MPTPIDTLVANFEGFQTELRTTLATQNSEIKQHGKSTEETGKKVDDITNRLSEIGQELKDVQAQVREVENSGARPRRGAESAKSLGTRFVESDEYKAIAGTNKTRSDAVAVGSFFPRAIDSGAASGGALIEPQRFAGIIADPERPMRLRDVMDVQPTDSNAIEYVEETGFTNNAAPRAEGAAAAQSALTYEVKTANVQTISHWLPATRQVLNDARQLQGQIDVRLLYGLKLTEEQQILFGNGTSPNLPGIATHANVQVHNWSQGPVGSGDTQIDAVRRAITKATIANYPVTAAVLHPTDWQNIELLKGSDKRYVWVSVNVGGQMMLWRVPVVETTAQTAGQYIVGAFGMAATLYDREQGQIRLSDSHSDFFIRGQVAVLAEERLALANFRPEGFVKGNFDNAPAAS